MTLYPLLYFLGIHFKMKEDDVLKDFLLLGMRVIFHGVDATLHNSNNQNISNSPPDENSSNNFVQERWKKTDCSKDRWSQSNNFFNHLLKTKLPGRQKVYFLCFSLFNWIVELWIAIAGSSYFANTVTLSRCDKRVALYKLIYLSISINYCSIVILVPTLNKQ